MLNVVHGTVSSSTEWMIMMELLIYPCLTLLFIFVMYILVAPYNHHLRRNTQNVELTVTKCASEHCVRCNKYRAVIKAASSKYESNPAIQHKAGARLHAAISTLKAERIFNEDDLQQPNILHLKDLEAKPVWPEEDFFSDVTILEDAVTDISQEFDHVYKHVWPEGWLLNNTPSGEWAVFHLINQGKPVTKNCELCPKTYSLITRLCNSMRHNVFSNASFSVVQSGTTISAHYGPTNTRLRCHLGLKVSPPESSYMLVNGEKISWEKGHCTIFDDSFLHEVHHDNELGKMRAVLLLDFWHPGLTDDEKELIDELFYPPAAAQTLVSTLSTLTIPNQQELI